jgi:hypothetical protein
MGTRDGGHILMGATVYHLRTGDFKLLFLKGWQQATVYQLRTGDFKLFLSQPLINI